ncbi:DUF1127 domain-containing protein [Psychromarinibacter sp. C21-152]|uniref:DUF1127 domain-containing protein n=1 Tax=Psychromarinibacter sediminicola TaxID=3033385 RepID=A0AAE3NSX2_9RHOB|nr:DUF1127 domain-containing protein [Psychromarinibacter sediminicola]MDF0603693.1 DUF1127 domain-containing protein [Psychromarinibacter sediminicola]
MSMMTAEGRPHTDSNAVARLLHAVAAPFRMIGEARDRMLAFEALDRKTDAELARMGLRREEIARRVFGLR